MNAVKSGYEIRMLSEAFDLNRQKRLMTEPIAFLRHDIDVSPRQAVNIARIESEAGVKATYYVRTSARYYQLADRTTLDDLAKIQEMGHDIGLHYYKHDDGNVESTAHKLEQFTNTPVLSVAFHMPGEKQLNLGLKYRGKVNVYAKELRVRYKSDSGGRWPDGNPILELEHNDKPIQILTHPVWWGEKAIPLEKRHKITMNLIHGW
jgi:hypothetical protein